MSQNLNPENLYFFGNSKFKNKLLSQSNQNASLGGIFNSVSTLWRSFNRLKSDIVVENKPFYKDASFESKWNSWLSNHLLFWLLKKIKSSDVLNTLIGKMRFFCALLTISSLLFSESLGVIATDLWHLKDNLEPDSRNFNKRTVECKSQSKERSKDRMKVLTIFDMLRNIYIYL